MRIFLKIQFILLLTLTSYFGVAQADLINPNNPNPVPTTNAMAFANQAGSIAGAAQACGQNLTTFNNRVNEALTKLAVSASDKLLAISIFQRSLQQAQAMQMTSHPIPCPQVLQDFSSLPLMQDDYRQSVISQLSPTMGNVPPPPQGTTNLPPNPSISSGANTTLPSPIGSSAEPAATDQANASNPQSDYNHPTGPTISPGTNTTLPAPMGSQNISPMGGGQANPNYSQQANPSSNPPPSSSYQDNTNMPQNSNNAATPNTPTEGYPSPQNNPTSSGSSDQSYPEDSNNHGGQTN